MGISCTAPTTPERGTSPNPKVQIVIVGSGGFGREVRWLIDSINAASPQFDLLGFVNTDRAPHGEIEGLPVFGREFFNREENRHVAAVIGIGNPATKKKVVNSLPEWLLYPNLVHPSAQLSPRVHLAGHGIVITAGCIFTTNIRIDSHVMVNLACTVGHDVEIGPFSVISPGVNVSGCVKVGAGASIGTGAAILEGRTVGEWSIVGASALVNRDVAANTTVVGVPAMPIKTREPGWENQ